MNLLAYIFLNVMKTHLAIIFLFLGLSACAGCSNGANDPLPNGGDPKKFLDDVNDALLKLNVEGQQAGWVSETYITDDTSSLNGKANQRIIEATERYARESVKFDKADVPADMRRQMNLLKLSLVMATPSDPKESEELTQIAAKLDGEYGKGKWCPDANKPDTCLDINQITDIMRDSRDEKKLRQVWEGWHTISPPMRPQYARFVELSNKGARELGFADTGAMWRSKYDMPPDAFSKELDRLWDQVRPLYLKLHAYVRIKLHEKYGDLVPEKGPIPAHLLGNVWAQEWTNIDPLVAPAHAAAGYSLTDIIKKRKITALDMVKTGERFYTSLGFDPLPK